MYRVVTFILAIIIISCSGCREDDGLFVISEQEINSGGANFTTFNFGENAFGVQGNELSRDESRFFSTGNSLFRSNWVAAPASVTSLDGVGPLLNARSCGSCHFKDGRAAPPDDPNANNAGILWRISVEGTSDVGGPKPHPVYGEQIQDQSLPSAAPEGKVITTYEEISGNYADGTPYTLIKPVFQLSELAYGEIEEAYQLSARIAPQLPGLGLLESIPASAILGQEDPNDSDQDGISGRANQVWDVKTQSVQLGRFGWKATQPTVEQQNAGAFNGDMGLTSNIFPEDEFSEAQELLYPDIINGGEPEVTDQQIQRITLYVKSLSVPAKRNTDLPEYFEGRFLFNTLKCNSCHTPSYITQDGNDIPSLDRQNIYPYTDLLLHDMGEGLADNRSDFLANGREWRTPPLWGIGLIPVVNDHSRLLHDGRARNIEEAILWHGGEAEQSKEEFKKLTKEEREALLLFLESI